MDTMPLPFRPTHSLLSPAQQEAAWAFILGRSEQIDRFAGRFFRLLGDQDRIDARADYIARLVEQHPSLKLHDARDVEKVIGTWLGWQARAIQQTYCRAYKKHLKDRDPNVVLTIVADQPGFIELPATGFGSVEQMEVDVQEEDTAELLEQLYGMATLPQREAMLAVLVEASPAEAHKRYKATSKARSRHLRELGSMADAAGLRC